MKTPRATTRPHSLCAGAEGLALRAMERLRSPKFKAKRSTNRRRGSRITSPAPKSHTIASWLSVSFQTSRCGGQGGLMTGLPLAPESAGPEMIKRLRNRTVLKRYPRAITA